MHGDIDDVKKYLDDAIDETAEAITVLEHTPTMSDYSGQRGEAFRRWLAAREAEVRADERAKIVGRLRRTGTTWEAVVAELAKIAERNMPGWDAGEMASTALRIVAERIVEAGHD